VCTGSPTGVHCLYTPILLSGSLLKLLVLPPSMRRKNHATLNLRPRTSAFALPFNIAPQTVMSSLKAFPHCCPFFFLSLLRFQLTQLTLPPSSPAGKSSVSSIPATVSSHTPIKQEQIRDLHVMISPLYQRNTPHVCFPLTHITWSPPVRSSDMLYKRKGFNANKDTQDSSNVEFYRRIC